MDPYIEDNNIQKRTHYEVLGLSPNCGISDIKSSYKNKLLAHHPDKNGSDSITIDNIQQAYKVLIDQEGRERYDESLKKSIQRQGFNITGDGLDVYSLDDFNMFENDSECKWRKDCPRCQYPKSIRVTETDLIEHGTEDGDNGFDIIVQCESCSLWIKVKYYEADDNENDIN